MLHGILLPLIAIALITLVIVYSIIQKYNPH